MWHEQQRMKLNAEMIHRQMVFQIVRQRFVERCVLLDRHRQTGLPNRWTPPSPSPFCLSSPLLLSPRQPPRFGVITLLTFLLFLFDFVFLQICHFLHIQLH